MDWTSFFSAFGGTAAGLMIAGWLGKNFVEHQLKKTSDAHRMQLQADHDIARQRAILELKNELTVLRERSAQLHDKRIDVIEKLYEGLTLTRTRAQEFLHPMEMAGAPSKEELLKPLIDAYNEVNKLFRAKRIYFSRDTCELVDAALSAIREPTQRFSFVLDYSKWDRAQFREKINVHANMWETFTEQVPKAMAAVEDEFRKLLGVGKEKTKP